MRASSTRNSPLPPSIEKAYRTKCIELKRRLSEIEESNDAARLRKQRLDRAISKMRINRAFLLNQLAKSQQFDAYESEKSSSPPPSPPERQHRTKRSYHRRSNPPLEHQTSIPSPPPGTLSQQQSHDRTRYNNENYGTQPLPGPPHQGPVPHSSPYASQYPSIPRIDRRPPKDIPLHEQLPTFSNVPPNTITTRPPPWTIRDLHERHHYYPEFDSLEAQQQIQLMRNGYTPLDMHGNAILIFVDPRTGRHGQAFRDEPVYEELLQRDRQQNEAAAQSRSVAPQPGLRGGESESREGSKGRDRDRERDHDGPPSGTASNDEAGAGFTAMNR